MAKDPNAIPPAAWEIVDFRAEPAGTGLVAVYLDEVGVAHWHSVVGWLGYGETAKVSPVRRWGAGVLYDNFPEVGPAWAVDEGETFVGIYDPAGGTSFDEWLADMTPKVEHWAEGEPMRIEIPEGARLVDVERSEG